MSDETKKPEITRLDFFGSMSGRVRLVDGACPFCGYVGKVQAKKWLLKCPQCNRRID